MGTRKGRQRCSFLFPRVHNRWGCRQPAVDNPPSLRKHLEERHRAFHRVILGDTQKTMNGACTASCMVCGNRCASSLRSRLQQERIHWAEVQCPRNRPVRTCNASTRAAIVIICASQAKAHGATGQHHGLSKCQLLRAQRVPLEKGRHGATRSPLWQCPNR